jgi:hypothetical protein
MQRCYNLRALSDGCGDGLRVSLQSPPVSTKPFASNATPDPDNQSVFGSAPMNKKRWGTFGRGSS